VAASQVKVLLDELAKVLGEIGALEETPPAEGDAAEGDMQSNAADVAFETAEKVETLLKRAEDLKAKIAFYERAAEKEKELRSVLERSAPAKAIEKRSESNEESTVEKRHFAVPKGHRPLKAFRGPDAEERAYRSGMHLKAYTFGDAEARRWCQDHGVEARAQAGGTNNLGGYLVDDVLMNEIIRLVEEYGAFPQYARRLPMTTDTMVVARRVGGLTARPIGENSEPAQSDVTFDNVELQAKIWGIQNRIPNSLLEDSVINLADLVAVETAQSFAEAFDNAAFIGDGTSAYHGTTGICTKILNSAHSKSVVSSASGNPTFDTLDLTDFTNVMSRLPLYASRNASWYISPAGYGSSMLRLAMSAGGVSTQNIEGGFGNTFLGYPVRLVHSMESGLTGTAGKVLALFGDLAQAATFGERRAVSLRTSTERFIEFDQTLTFATTRVAMVVHDLGSTTVAGPVVALVAYDD
jgi:HK97 family phage major capsid protein